MVVVVVGVGVGVGVVMTQRPWATEALVLEHASLNTLSELQRRRMRQIEAHVEQALADDADLQAWVKANPDVLADALRVRCSLRGAAPPFELCDEVMDLLRLGRRVGAEVFRRAMVER